MAEQKINLDRVIRKTLDIVVKEKYLEKMALIKNHYKETERLLYSYVDLKRQIEQSQEYIEDLRSEGYNEKSKDIIKWSSGSKAESLTRDEIHEELIRQRQDSMKRTKAQVAWVDKCLDCIKDDEFYQILDLRYSQGLDLISIAEHMHTSERTIRRRKSMLINRLSLFLTGQTQGMQ